MTHLIPKFNIRISTIKNYTYNINVPICFLQNVKQQVDRQTDRRTDTAWQHIAALAAWLGCSRAANRLRSRYCKTVKVKVWTLVIAPLIWVRLVTSSAYNLGSGSWLAWANGAAAHYVAIHYPRQQTIGPTVQLADIPSPQSATIQAFTP